MGKQKVKQQPAAIAKPEQIQKYSADIDKTYSARSTIERFEQLNSRTRYSAGSTSSVQTRKDLSSTRNCSNREKQQNLSQKRSKSLTSMRQRSIRQQSQSRAPTGEIARDARSALRRSASIDKSDLYPLKPILKHRSDVSGLWQDKKRGSPVVRKVSISSADDDGEVFVKKTDLPKPRRSLRESLAAGRIKTEHSRIKSETTRASAGNSIMQQPIIGEKGHEVKSAHLSSTNQHVNYLANDISCDNYYEAECANGGTGGKNRPLAELNHKSHNHLMVSSPNQLLAPSSTELHNPYREIWIGKLGKPLQTSKATESLESHQTESVTVFGAFKPVTESYHIYHLKESKDLIDLSIELPASPPMKERTAVETVETCEESVKKDSTTKIIPEKFLTTEEFVFDLPEKSSTQMTVNEQLELQIATLSDIDSFSNVAIKCHSKDEVSPQSTTGSKTEVWDINNTNPLILIDSCDSSALTIAEMSNPSIDKNNTSINSSLLETPPEEKQPIDDSYQSVLIPPPCSFVDIIDHDSSIPLMSEDYPNEVKLSTPVTRKVNKSPDSSSNNLAICANGHVDVLLSGTDSSTSTPPCLLSNPVTECVESASLQTALHRVMLDVKTVTNPHTADSSDTDSSQSNSTSSTSANDCTTLLLLQSTRAANSSSERVSECESASSSGSKKRVTISTKEVFRRRHSEKGTSKGILKHTSDIPKYNVELRDKTRHVSKELRSRMTRSYSTSYIDDDESSTSEQHYLTFIASDEHIATERKPSIDYQSLPRLKLPKRPQKPRSNSLDVLNEIGPEASFQNYTLPWEIGRLNNVINKSQTLSHGTDPATIASYKQSHYKGSLTNRLAKMFTRSKNKSSRSNSIASTDSEETFDSLYSEWLDESAKRLPLRTR